MSNIAEFKRRLAEYESSKITLEEYRRAVEILVPAAMTDTSGGRAAAGVLLAAYNATKFHLDITELCVLDLDLYPSALAVIRGRAELCREPHTLIENGDAVFGQIWEEWECLSIVRRAKKLRD